VESLIQLLVDLTLTMESSLLVMELKLDKTIGLLRTHGVQLGEKLDMSDLPELVTELVSAVSRVNHHIPLFENIIDSYTCGKT